MPFATTWMNTEVVTLSEVTETKEIYDSVCCCLVAKSCPTLCNPMDCSLPGFSIHGISQARILESVAISFLQGIFLTEGLNPCLLHCRWVLYHSAIRET